MVKHPQLGPLTTPKELMLAYDGLYVCPVDEEGNRTGPIVGYAGRDSKGRQFLGDIFTNFAAVSRYPSVLDKHVVRRLVRRLELVCKNVDLICPAPKGGNRLAKRMARKMRRPCLVPRKVVLEKATPSSRERTVLRLPRKIDLAGKHVIIVEDVCNNFSTTRQFIEEIESRGGKVVAIVCFLNRSPTVRSVFYVPIPETASAISYPVIALWNTSMAEYEEDDPRVIKDVQAGNLIREPKEHWEKLMNFMKNAARAA